MFIESSDVGIFKTGNSGRFKETLLIVSTELVSRAGYRGLRWYIDGMSFDSLEEVKVCFKNIDDEYLTQLVLIYGLPNYETNKL